MEAQPPVPCPSPALEQGILRCDGQGEQMGRSAWLVGQRLDLNLATQEDLAELPKIGPALARAIVETRDAQGGFTSLEEVRRVPGIGVKTYLRIRPYLRIAR